MGNLKITPLFFNATKLNTTDYIWKNIVIEESGSTNIFRNFWSVLFSLTD